MFPRTYAIERFPAVSLATDGKRSPSEGAQSLPHAVPGRCGQGGQSCYAQPFDIIKHMTSTAEHGPEAIAGHASGNQTRTAADFGDIRSEFAALASGCGVFDIGPRAKVELTGRDRVRWLNGMVSNNIRELAPGGGVYAFLLNPQGHILADLYAYNRGESLLVDIDVSQLQKVLELFRRYIIMDKVELNTNASVSTMGVAGPSAEEVLRRAGIEIPELEQLGIADLNWAQTPLTIIRGDNPILPWFELWSGPESRAILWESLVPAGGRPVGTTAQELWRIASGVPRYGQDIRDRDLPQETGQKRALNFTKGCYIGQEIVERIHSRGSVHRNFTGFEIDGPLPAPGTKVQGEGKDVGEITSSAALPVPDGERKVALGYIRRESAAPGRELIAAQSRVRVAELPFKNLAARN
jgi:folate-binding protein YgfZ